jgi:hypothetical protein
MGPRMMRDTPELLVRGTEVTMIATASGYRVSER